MFLKSFFLLFSLTILSNYIHAQTDSIYASKKWKYTDFGTHIGYSNILNYDVDKDGTDEIVLNSGYNNQSHLRILKNINNDYKSIWISKNYGQSIIQLFTIKDIDQDRTDELIIVLNNGTLEIYDLSSLKLKTTHSITATYPSAMEIIDIDNDGVQEYLFAANNYFKVINSITYEEEFSSNTLNALDIEVGDVDNDGSDDIILSSGKVLDALTYQVKWEYAGGFGNKIALADVDQDSVKEIISIGNYYYITAYDAEFKTPLWQFNTRQDLQGFLVTDYDNDKSPDIIVGSTGFGNMVCYRSSDRSVLWELQNQSPGTTNISATDLDNDGVKEIIWGAGYTTNTEDNLFIADPLSKLIEWKSLDLDSPFYVSTLDIDNDNITEIVGASFGSRSGGNKGVLFVFNSEDLHTKYSAPALSHITALTTANIDGKNSGEVIYALENKLCVVDGNNNTIIYQYSLPYSGVITAIKVDDIDNDGIQEIIIGDSWGYITVLDSRNLSQEWQSINTGNAISQIIIDNYDNDDSKEIIFFNPNGYIQVYDGTTHFLEKQLNKIDSISAIDFADIDLDGIKEFVIGKKNGSIEIVDSKTYQRESVHQVSNEAINSITIANLDSSYGYEVITGTSLITVFSANDFKKKWESEFLCFDVGLGDNLLVKDIDNNGYNDIIAAGRWGIFHYEVNSKFPDFTPPFVKMHKPSHGQTSVGVNSDIEVLFSEQIDTTGVFDKIFIKKSNNENIPFSYLYNNSLLILQADSLFSLNDTIKIILTNKIQDISGNYFDGNKNGISEPDSIDNYTFSFTTGSGIDTVSPVFFNITCTDTVWKGMQAKIHAEVSDYSSIATGGLYYFEYYIDSLRAFGTGIPLMPDDGTVDSHLESVSLELYTETWGYGDHYVYLAAKDQSNNWGVVNIKIHVRKENNSNWVTNGYNNLHTGFNEYDSISFPLTRLLRKEYTYYKLSPITVINDKMIFAANDLSSNKLFCCKTDNGDTLWSKEFSSNSFISQASFAYGKIYLQVTFVSTNNYLYCLNPDTGEEIWKIPFPLYSNECFAPAVSNGKVFANFGLNGGLYAINAEGGGQIWAAALPELDKWSPAVYNNVVYTNVENKLSAFDQNTGTLLWDKTLAYEQYTLGMNTSPVIDTASNTIFVTSRQYLHAVDIITHEVKWMKKGIFPVTPALCDNQLYVINGNGLIVYDVLNGATLWSFNPQYSFIHSPVISNGFVFISGIDETYCLNIKEKKSVWKYPTSGRLTIANNKLFIASDSGYVLIFGKGTTGNIADNIQTPENYALLQNYPNPFNPSTTIEYHLPAAAVIKLQVYNTMGELVETLAEGYEPAGYYKKTWNADNFTSGVYFFRIYAENENSKFTETKKMVFLK